MQSSAKDWKCSERTIAPTASGAAEYSRRVLEGIELPAMLKKIKDNAFRGCKHLKGIALPDEVGHVGERCFQESALESINFLPALRQ